MSLIISSPYSTSKEIAIYHQDIINEPYAWLFFFPAYDAANYQQIEQLISAGDSFDHYRISTFEVVSADPSATFNELIVLADYAPTNLSTPYSVLLDNDVTTVTKHYFNNDLDPKKILANSINLQLPSNSPLTQGVALRISFPSTYDTFDPVTREAKLPDFYYVVTLSRSRTQYVLLDRIDLRPYKTPSNVDTIIEIPFGGPSSYFAGRIVNLRHKSTRRSNINPPFYTDMRIRDSVRKYAELWALEASTDGTYDLYSEIVFESINPTGGVGIGGTDSNATYVYYNDGTVRPFVGSNADSTTIIQSGLPTFNAGDIISHRFYASQKISEIYVNNNFVVSFSTDGATTIVDFLQPSVGQDIATIRYNAGLDPFVYPMPPGFYPRGAVDVDNYNNGNALPLFETA